MPDIAPLFNSLIKTESVGLTTRDFPDGVAWVRDPGARLSLWLDGEDAVLLEATMNVSDALHSTELRLSVLTGRFYVSVRIEKPMVSIYHTDIAWEMVLRASLRNLDAEFIEPRAKDDWLVMTAEFKGITGTVKLCDPDRLDLTSDLRREIFLSLRDDLFAPSSRLSTQTPLQRIQRGPRGWRCEEIEQGFRQGRAPSRRETAEASRWRSSVPRRNTNCLPDGPRLSSGDAARRAG